MENPLKEYVFIAPPGTPYKPSNGREGMAFESAFCDNCTKEDGEVGRYCDIHAIALLGAQPKEWVHDENGVPSCTEWEAK